MTTPPTPTNILYDTDLSGTTTGVTSIIAGSRSATESDGVNLTTDALVQLLTGVFTTIDVSPSLVVSGTARGVDSAGEEWARRHNIPVAQFEAQWDDTDHPDAVVKNGKYGPYDAAAGHRRNESMADFAASHSDRGILIAVLDAPSSGTESMIQLARETLGDENVFVIPLTSFPDSAARSELSDVLVTM